MQQIVLFFQAPLQSIQPFALVESLQRLGLTPAGSVPDVVCLDVSARVTEHLQAAAARARQARPYRLTLPLGRDTRWSTELVEYWRRAGTVIGNELASPPSAPGNVAVRSVAVRPEIVTRVTAYPLNIVVQRLSETAFDLIVATNVLTYYDELEQALAFTNIDAMLSPGGLFLSNSVLPATTGVRSRLVSSQRVDYSADDWDAVLTYQRTRD